MTLNEFGLKLREKFPKLEQIPLNNEALAQYVLNRYPQYYDYISPVARKIKEISNREFSSSRWTEQGRLESQTLHIQNQGSEITMLHNADLAIKASAMGIPVAALHEIAVEEHKTHETMKLEVFRRDNGLDGNNIAKLSLHQQIDVLHGKLETLIDRRDKETHPDKRKALNTRIVHLQEELDARGQQAVVQAGGRSRLGDAEDTNSTRSSGETNEGNVEQLSVTKHRVGF